MTAYLTRCGIALDILLNVILGGAAGQTISLRAAIAARDGSRAGCIVCAALSALVQRNHCALQFTDAPTPVWDGIRAFVLLCLLAAVLWHIPVMLVHLAIRL